MYNADHDNHNDDNDDNDVKCSNCTEQTPGEPEKKQRLLSLASSLSLVTPVGISVYLQHAVNKISNEWLFSPQKGFIPIEVSRAPLLG